MSNWDHVSSKLGNVQPATRSIAKELYDVAAANGHEIWFMWGMGPSSEHSTGRALDLMVRNKAAGDFLRNYVWQNRARLRLRHVIWWQRITSTVTQPGVVRKMADRGDPTQNHEDHPHILVEPGEYRPPAGGTVISSGTKVSNKATTPRINRATVSYVQNFQRLLKVGVDGLWGPQTDARAMRMRAAARNKAGFPQNVKISFNIRDVQGVIGTKVDGIWGPNSQRSLVAWIRQFQGALNVATDGQWGPKTDNKLIQVRRKYNGRY